MKHNNKLFLGMLACATLFISDTIGSEIDNKTNSSSTASNSIPPQKPSIFKKTHNSLNSHYTTYGGVYKHITLHLGSIAAGAALAYYSPRTGHPLKAFWSGIGLMTSGTYNLLGTGRFLNAALWSLPLFIAYKMPPTTRNKAIAGGSAFVLSQGLANYLRNKLPGKMLTLLNTRGLSGKWREAQNIKNHADEE